MAQTHIVFNEDLELFGERFITKVAPIPPDVDISYDYQKKKLLSLLFEQFLLFDKIALKVDRQNLALYFLIQELGVNKVEELIEYGIIKLVLWTPKIVAMIGSQKDDGTTDHTTVFGRPPLVSGNNAPEDSDPERNIDQLLNHFQLHKDRKRLFKRKALKQFIIPDKNIAGHATELVIDAYVNNRLTQFGLPAETSPDMLNHHKREVLLDLGNQILTTAVLADKQLKSYDKYSYFSITQESIRKIESAYHVSENTSQIMKVENIANIQSLVFENKIPFDRVFDLRYKPNIKHYRKWINSISESVDTKAITKEYIDEVIGKNKFFESTGGKFLRTVGMFGVGTGIGAIMAGPMGALLGAGAGKAADLGLALLDTYVLEGILKGWNPRMFIEEVKVESEPPPTLYSPKK